MQEPALQASSIHLSIEDIQILKSVDLSLYPGELHIVLGENGAGKSSLAKVLCGIYTGYTGNINIDGQEVRISSPEQARKHGIIAIQQDSTVFENLTVAENIFVNNPDYFKGPFSMIHKNKLYKQAQEILERLHFPLDTHAKVKYLDLAQKRMVELARVSLLKPRILILDEPTASLNFSEASAFMEVINQFRQQSVAVMVITHLIKEFSKSADRVTILRDGEVVATEAGYQHTAEDIGRKIWGKYYTNKYPKLAVKPGKEIFCVEDLCTKDLLDHISFSLHQGEILGVTGLVGSGRSQLAQAIVGQHPRTKGAFYVDRLEARIERPKDAIDYGIAFVTEDRYENGLFLNLNVLKNVFSINKTASKNIIINQKQHLRLFNTYQKKINLHIQNPSGKSFPTISGGTQQKVILMRWILSSAKIFIFDEPTQGVDIASKVDIYNLLNNLAREKAGILLISSSFEELTGMCDRVLILKNGTIAHEAKRSHRGDYENLYEYII